MSHCHIVSPRRSHSLGAGAGGWGYLLSLAVIYPNIGPSSAQSTLVFRSEGKTAELVLLCGWSDHLRAGCHSLITETARHLRREKLSRVFFSFSALILITEPVFRVPPCHSVHAVFTVHFSDVTLGRVVFCVVGWTVNRPGEK